MPRVSPEQNEMVTKDEGNDRRNVTLLTIYHYEGSPNCCCCSPKHTKLIILAALILLLLSLITIFVIVLCDRPPDSKPTAQTDLRIASPKTSAIPPTNPFYGHSSTSISMPTPNSVPTSTPVPTPTSVPTPRPTSTLPSQLPITTETAYFPPEHRLNATFNINCSGFGISTTKKICFLDEENLMVLKGGQTKHILKVNINTCQQSELATDANAYDLACAGDGLAYITNRRVIIYDNANGEFSDWAPHGMVAPRLVSVNNNTIICQDYDRSKPFVYDRSNREFLNHLDLDIDSQVYYNHLADGGLYLYTTEYTLYIHNMTDSRTVSLGGRGTADGEFMAAAAIASPFAGRYILVSDSGLQRISVVTREGDFIHQLGMKGPGVAKLVATVDRPGRDSLMAVGGYSHDEISIYSLTIS